jgi:hypothetical protein
VGVEAKSGKIWVSKEKCKKHPCWRENKSQQLRWSLQPSQRERNLEPGLWWFPTSCGRVTCLQSERMLPGSRSFYSKPQSRLGSWNDGNLSHSLPDLVLHFRWDDMVSSAPVIKLMKDVECVRCDAWVCQVWCCECVRCDALSVSGVMLCVRCDAVSECVRCDAVCQVWCCECVRCDAVSVSGVMLWVSVSGVMLWVCQVWCCECVRCDAVSVSGVMLCASGVMLCVRCDAVCQVWSVSVSGAMLCVSGEMLCQVWCCECVRCDAVSVSGIILLSTIREYTAPLQLGRSVTTGSWNNTKLSPVLEGGGSDEGLSRVDFCVR